MFEHHARHEIFYRLFKIPIPSILEIMITYRVSVQQRGTQLSKTGFFRILFVKTCPNILILLVYTLLYEIIGISVSFRESVIRNPLVIPQASSAQRVRSSEHVV